MGDIKTFPRENTFPFWGHQDMVMPVASIEHVENLAPTIYGHGTMPPHVKSTRVAEIGQAKLDRQEEEQKVGQAPVQEDNVEGNVEEAEESAAMDQGNPTPSIRRYAPEPQRFDMSPRGTSVSQEESRG